MKRIAVFAILVSCIASMATAQSKSFIDTSRPDEIVTFGVRAGLNSSGLSNNYIAMQPEMIQNNFYWRMGAQIGGVADLHIRNFFALQTGLMWENRSYDCALMAANSSDDYMGSMFVNAKFNYLHFPVMLSFRFNLLKDLIWQFDLGGYYAYGVCGKKKQYAYYAYGESEGELIFEKNITKTDYFGADSKDFLAVWRSDIGLKIGTGLTVFNHYFIGVYYQRSLKNIAKQSEGSAPVKIRNCTWNVSLGYNF